MYFVNSIINILAQNEVPRYLEQGEMGRGLPSAPLVSSMGFQPRAPPLHSHRYVWFEAFTSVLSFEVDVLHGFPGAEPETEILV